MRFLGQIAIVTGGGSGMGKETAARFVAEGGSVVINGRNAAKAEAVAREIDPTGTRVVVHAGDVSVPATGEALVKTALERFGAPRRAVQQCRCFRAEAVSRRHRGRVRP